MISPWHKILVSSLHYSLHICEYTVVKCVTHGKLQWPCYALHRSMGLMRTCRLFDLVIVIPSSLSELKLEKCRNLYECTYIQGNCKILKIIDYVAAKNSTSIAHK